MRAATLRFWSGRVVSTSTASNASWLGSAAPHESPKSGQTGNNESIYPNFDQSQYGLSGTFNATGGRTVEQFLDRLADDLPADAAASRERRLAAALVAVAEDYLNSHRGARDTAASPMGVINVHADAGLLGGSLGEAGAEIEFGPNIGPAALEELLCTGKVRVILTEDNLPVAATNATRHIPPQIRAFVQKRDGACTISGCNSRYRLEPHHIIPWSEGGTHHPDNLTTLCWYHHHVAIHQDGRQLDPDSPPQNRTLLPIRARAPPGWE
ncbi:MAG: HNH endonuclease [Acidimicrobiia bacterium]|nr:HNH endonuclease [Acidimicrobiia bacterium]